MPAAIRKINNQGISMIVNHEKCKLKSYVCPAGVLTIGYGHTGRDVKNGMEITQADAERILLSDLEKFCAAVERLVKVPLSDNQFAALVSLCFNIGEGAFGKSTLLKKLNAGDIIGAVQEFPKWNRGGGKVLPGLVRRREDEQRLFIK